MTESKSSFRDRSLSEIERKSEQLLALWQPGCLENSQPVDLPGTLDEFLWDQYEFRLAVEDRVPAPYRALTDFRTRTLHLSARDYAGCKNDRRACRFVVAHELGHIALHENEARSGSLALRRAEALKTGAEDDEWMDPEWQADGFASAVLMPRNPLLSLVPADIGKAGERIPTKKIAETFCVPESIVTPRVEDCRNISVLEDSWTSVAGRRRGQVTHRYAGEPVERFRRRHYEAVLRRELRDPPVWPVNHVER